MHPLTFFVFTAFKTMRSDMIFFRGASLLDAKGATVTILVCFLAVI